MKDMLGIELELGQHVIYFHSWSGGVCHEEAKIIRIRKDSIRIEYLGNIRKGGKKLKGQKSNVYNVKGRIFVFSQSINKERISFLERIAELTIQNVILEQELEKIHFRSDILDL